MPGEPNKLFDHLIREATNCVTCQRMHASHCVVGRASGRTDAPVLFIGEAPGRLGADASAVPFHGDKAGDNFEQLVEQVGLSRYDFFITNAVLCNPKDEKGNNATPNRREIENCSNFLKRQLDLVNPRIVVTLGAQALNALKLIEPHDIELSRDIRKAWRWYNRILVPLYHPGQRAMIHRSFLNQLADYRFVAETHRRLNHKKNSNTAPTASTASAVQIAKALLVRGPLTYFSLHKLFYLVEYEHYKLKKRRLTSCYMIRQKDGPYVVDLHIKKLKRAMPEIRSWFNDGKMLVGLENNVPLFTTNIAQQADSGNFATELINTVLDQFGSRSDEQLKTAVYLTAPMRHILRREKYGKANMFNAPIDFSTMDDRK